MVEFCIFEIPWYVVEMPLPELKTHYQDDKENFTLYNFKTGEARPLDPNLKHDAEYMEIFNSRCDYLPRHIDELLSKGFHVFEEVIDNNGFIRIKTRTNYLENKLDKLNEAEELTEEMRYKREFYSLLFLALDEAQILTVM